MPVGAGTAKEEVTAVHEIDSMEAEIRVFREVSR
jgi:hypothetical protein